MLTVLFGTDGIRSRVGTWPLNKKHISVVAHTLGVWIVKTYGLHARVLITHDTRTSAYWLKTELSGGLLLNGCLLFDAQIMGTPAASFLMRYTSDYDCAIIITASHNPYNDNGIKIIKKGGNKLTEDEEQAIVNLFDQYSDSSWDISIDYNQLGTLTVLKDPLNLYVQHVKTFIPKNMLLHKIIVIDCAHGATSAYAKDIFLSTGAQIILINAEPNGKNINRECGAAHPEQLRKAVLEHHADIGFAFDGDGDRIIAITANGHYKDGDDILYILMQHPLYASMPTMVGTVMTNQGLAQYLDINKKNIIRTAVGDKYISQELHKQNMLLGGEPSGHIIMYDYLEISDGIAIALRICYTLELTHNWSMETFKKVPHIMINLPIKEKKPLDHEPLKTLISRTEEKLPQGRILIRYSGTEPLLRILIEDLDLNHAEHVGIDLGKQLENILT
jgi:phosphoglucosamine mutase